MKRFALMMLIAVNVLPALSQQLKIFTIEFGYVSLCDKTVSKLYYENLTPETIIIDDIILEQDEEQDIFLLGELRDKTLEPYSIDSIEVEAMLTPDKFMGLYTAIVKIKPRDLPPAIDTLYINAVPLSLTPVYFNNAKIGVKLMKSAFLRNCSDKSIQIDSISLLGCSDEVSISKGALYSKPYFVLEPQSYIYIPIYFKPSKEGSFSCRLVIHTKNEEISCAINGYAKAEGAAKYSSLSVISTPNSALPGVSAQGNPVTVKLRVNDLENSPVLFKNYRAVIQFDKNVLYPKLTSQNMRLNTIGDFRRVEVDGLWNGKDSIIFSFPAEVMLSDRDSTRIIIEHFSWVNQQMNTETSDDRFYVITCSAGGERRIIKSDDTRIMNIFPAPANDFVNVEFNLKYKNPVLITVSDIYGSTLKEFPIGELEKGSYTEKIDLSGLPSGNYSIILKAGQDIIYKQVSLYK